MKRSERHHLKENTFANWMADVTAAMAERGRAVGFVAVAVLLAVVAAGAYTYWRSQEAARADARLTDALATSEAPVVPPAADTQPQPGTFSTETARLDAVLPKFLAVAEEHPGSRAAIPARYHAANTLAALGRHAEAEEHYRGVMGADSSGIYGSMAELGLAQSLAAAGRYDEAIALFQRLATAANTRLPVDGILMQLARTYHAAGRPAEAVQAYQRIIDEFPQSPYGADARQAIGQIGQS